MDEVDLGNQIRDADHADRVLNDPLLNNAFQSLQVQYLDRLLNCDPKDDLGRYRFAEAIKTVRSVLEHLRSVVENGKVAAHDLDALKGKRRFFF